MDYRVTNENHYHSFYDVSSLIFNRIPVIVMQLLEAFAQGWRLVILVGKSIHQHTRDSEMAHHCMVAREAILSSLWEKGAFIPLPWVKPQHFLRWCNCANRTRNAFGGGGDQSQRPPQAKGIFVPSTHGCIAAASELESCIGLGLSSLKNWKW